MLYTLYSPLRWGWFLLCGGGQRGCKTRREHFPLTPSPQGSLHTCPSAALGLGAELCTEPAMSPQLCTEPAALRCQHSSQGTGRGPGTEPCGTDCTGSSATRMGIMLLGKVTMSENHQCPERHPSTRLRFSKCHGAVQHGALSGAGGVQRICAARHFLHTQMLVPWSRRLCQTGGGRNASQVVSGRWKFKKSGKIMKKREICNGIVTERPTKRLYVTSYRSVSPSIHRNTVQI